MAKLALLFLPLFVLASCSDGIDHKLQSITQEKTVILKQEDAEELLYWEMDNSPSLFEYKLGNIDALSLYRDTLKKHLGTQTLESTINKQASQDWDESQFENETNGDKINSLLIHTGKFGRIRPINYLEAQILNYQLGRYPLFSHPTEFHGFILKNEQEGKVRVYFGASDTEWPPKAHLIIDEVEKEMQNGWVLKSHLHNHYCKKDGNYVGMLAPSLADAHYYKMLKEDFHVETTLITNGFHTVELQSDNFTKFQSH